MSADRHSLMRCLGILGAVNAILSIIAIIVGAIAVNTSNTKFPYNAGGGVIAGVTAIFTSLCPLYTYLSYKKNPGKDYDGCMLCMVIYLGSVGLWGPPIALGMCGVYGLVECASPDGGRGGVDSDLWSKSAVQAAIQKQNSVCSENADIKIAMCYLTLFISAFLIAVELSIFFTCCCNSSKFGIPLTTGASSSYFDRDVSAYLERYLNEARLEEARAQNMLNTRQVAPPTNNQDTGNEARGEVPTAPEMDSGVNPSDFSVPSETTFNDPPPSYDEVMRGTDV